MSYAIANIKKYQSRVCKELLLTVGYHFLETITAVGIIAFGIMIMTIR
jgi:hypothetical protein